MGSTNLEGGKPANAADRIIKNAAIGMFDLYRIGGERGRRPLKKAGEHDRSTGRAAQPVRPQVRPIAETVDG